MQNNTTCKFNGGATRISVAPPEINSAKQQEGKDGCDDRKLNRGAPTATLYTKAANRKKFAAQAMADEVGATNHEHECLTSPFR